MALLRLTCAALTPPSPKTGCAEVAPNVDSSVLSDSALLATLAPAALACPLASITPGLSLRSNVLGACSIYGSVEATIGSTAGVGGCACVAEKVSTETANPTSNITAVMPTQLACQRKSAFERFILNSSNEMKRVYSKLVTGVSSNSSIRIAARTASHSLPI